MNSKLYTMLMPILKVKDLDAEVAFYLSLGFELSYDAEEFKAIKYADTIEFGLGRKADVNIKEVSRHFTWQIAVNSVQSVLDMCREKNLQIVGDLKSTPTILEMFTQLQSNPRMAMMLSLRETCKIKRMIVRDTILSVYKPS